MSKQHPTPWALGYYKDIDGSPVFDLDEPIVDASGKTVVYTDSGFYPPDKETAMEIVAAVNEKQSRDAAGEMLDGRPPAGSLQDEDKKEKVTELSVPRGFEVMEFESSETILSAMMNGIIIPHKRDDELLRHYASFLHAALERERKKNYCVLDELKKEIERFRNGVVCCGGAATYRKALLEVERWFEGVLRWCHRMSAGEVVEVTSYSGFWILDKIKGFLAAPSRNVEMYPSRHAAFVAYEALRPTPHWFEGDGCHAVFAVAFEDWLWLPVKADNRYTHKEHDKWLDGTADDVGRPGVAENGGGEMRRNRKN